MSQKNAFIANQENFISRKFYEFHSKPFFTYKNFFCTCLSSLSAKNSHYHKPKVFLLQKALRTVLKNRLFMCKKSFIRTNLSLFLSKATLFHPPSSIRTTLNLLFAKNTAVLLLFALILCCKAGASHRFKSSPAIPGNLAVPGATGYLMNAGHLG